MKKILLVLTVALLVAFCVVPVVSAATAGSPVATSDTASIDTATRDFGTAPPYQLELPTEGGGPTPIPFLNKLYETFIKTGHWEMMLEGLGNTIGITLGALLIGVIIGTLIAVVKYFGDDNKIIKPFAKLCDIYVTLIRGLPVTVLLLIFYYIIFVSSDDGVMVATITFGINSGAYMAELIRSGINAVDRGQMEAGRSLGLSKLQTMYKIILPQAIRYILPAIGNELIALLKETSVAGYVAVVDLTRAGNVVRNLTFDAVSVLTVVAIVYLLMVIGLTKLLKMFERRLAKSDKR